MNTRFILLISSCLLMLGFGCSPDSGASGPKRNGIKASSIVKSGPNRNGIKATSIVTKYEYGEGINAAIGIPSGAKVYRTQNREPVGEPVLVASDATLVDESVDGEEMRVIRVNFSLRNDQGGEVVNMVAFFRPFAEDSYVVKTILQSRYVSIYKWGDIPGHSLVTVTTTDLSSGKKVLETMDLDFIGNSQGLFRGLEHHFIDGNVVCTSAFVRHIGTGLLVEEQVQEGVLPMDYHTYEFVLAGWPSGRSPDFGGGFGGGMGGGFGGGMGGFGGGGVY